MQDPASGHAFVGRGPESAHGQQNHPAQIPAQLHLAVPRGGRFGRSRLVRGVLTIRAARNAPYYEAREFVREDYYREAGLAPGRFVGREAEHLGLEGPPERGQLQALLEGRDPLSGERLPGLSDGRRNAGFDLTFTAPKSVSVLLAVGDERVRQAVLDAQEAGAAAGLDYLERHELQARRGAGGQRIVAAHGFVGARYTHEMSRSGDPHLHTHVVVANAVRGPDGRYSAPDMRPIFGAAKTAGTMAEAVLRHELTQALGVEWEPVRNGTAEIAGIPSAVLAHFSSRHQEIAELAAVRGSTSLQAVGAAQRQTRDRKPVIDRDTAQADWRARAAEQGFGRAELQPASSIAPLGDRALIPHALDALEARLAGPEGLTQRASTFTRREVLRAYAEAHAQGATLARLEALADGFLARRAVLLEPALPGARAARPLHHPGPAARRGAPAGPGQRARRLGSRSPPRRWTRPFAPTRTWAPTSRPRCATWPRATGACACWRPTPGGARPPPCARWPTPTPAPATRCGARPGRARRPRTFTARPASRPRPRRACSTAWPATPRPCPTDAVLIVDEAATMPTRALAELLEHVAARRGRLVLVGDRAQLPAIDAGGAFAALADRLGAADAHRESPPAGSRAARGGRRAGRRSPAGGPGPAQRPRRPAHLRRPRGRPRPVDRGLGAGCARRSRGRPHPGPRPGRRARAERHGPGPARRGRTARPRAPGGARARVGARRPPGLPAQRLPGRPRCPKRHPGHGGHRATPRPARSPCGPTTAAPSSCPPDYLEHAHHGYALTGHVSQGATVERTYLLATPERGGAEWAYVAASRHRIDLRVYLSADEPERAAEALAERWERRQAKHLATERLEAAGRGAPEHGPAPAREPEAPAPTAERAPARGAEDPLAALRAERAALLAELRAGGPARPERGAAPPGRRARARGRRLGARSR